MLYFCPIYGELFEGLGNYNCYSDSLHYRSNGTENTIIDLWNTVSVPPAPELKAVSVGPKTSALLILDMETTICKSPRCTASISKIHDLLVQARKNNMLVVYSLTHIGNPSNITKQLAPMPGDPIVKSNVDKFYKTNLEGILRKKGIRTVIVTGFAANGAVLHTATSAAFRGFNVVVPVDCMSTANILYSEQYTAWHMLNSPGTRGKAVLSKVNLINFLH